MAWRKLNGGGSCADYQHSLDMHNAAALVADTTSKQEMRGDNHQSESPQPDSDPHSRSGVQEANAGDRQIAPEVAPELSTSQGSSPQARAKVEPKHTPASQQKKAEEKSIPAAPECPSSDAEWKTTTCLQLFTFWRGKPLLAKHQLMKASQCAKALAENYTREQVEGVRLFMVERDSWWSLRPEAVDVCTVAENMHKKLAEMDRANGKARKAGPRKVIPTREQDPYSIAALLEEQNPGYHACKAEMEASLWTN